MESLDTGCYIGITGWLCDERRGMRELVKRFPADWLMVEPDCLYLLPRTLRPLPKDRRNEPTFLPHIVEALLSAGFYSVLSFLSLLAAWHRVQAQPSGEGGFTQAAIGYGQHREHTLTVFGLQGLAIEPEKQFHRDKGGAFVAVDERVVARDAAAVSGSQVRDIWLAVTRQLLWSGQRRFEQTDVASARRAAMFSQLFLVNGGQDSRVQPDPGIFHFASSRSTCRRRFITSRAAVIWSSNSAS